MAAGKDWIELRSRAIRGGFYSFTDEEIEKATAARMKMSHPTAYNHANVLRWMKAEGIECVGSLEEADLQMIKLEKDGVVDGIISEDGDEFALGAENRYCKMNRKPNGEYRFKVLNGSAFFDPSNPFKSKLNRFPDQVIDAALLLGNDYCPRIESNGAVKVLLGSLERLPRLPSGAMPAQKES